MPLTADDIPSLLQSKEFNALPYPERTRIAEDALAEGSASLAGSWDRETYQRWGEFANTVRSDLEESETLVDKAKDVGGTLKQIGKDALGTIGATVAGLSPVLPMPEGGFKAQIPGETLAPQLVTNLARFGTGQVEKLIRDSTPVVNALSDVKKGIDNGAFFDHPEGLPGWLDAVNGLVTEQTGKYYGTAGGATDWAQQNGLLTNPENAGLLNTYLRTRSPEAWAALEDNLLRTPAAAQMRETNRQLQEESTLGRALAPDARPLIQNAADPTEWIAAGKTVKAGVKAASAGLKTLQRAKELGKGLLYEQLGEQLSAMIDDPNVSLQERAEIAKQALIGSLGFAGVGAGARAVQQRINGTTTPTPGQLDGQLPGNEAPPANPFEGPIEAPPQPTEDGGIVPPAGPQPVPAFQDDPLGTLAPQPAGGNLIVDYGLQRTPEAQAQLEQRQQEYQQSQTAAQGQINRAGNRMPLIPDNPLGYRDILDFVNDNPLYIPRKDSPEAKAPEYDWTQNYELPKYYRKFIASSERGMAADQLAQMAFEEGYITEPTPDALLDQINKTVRERTQYKVQFRKQQQGLRETERRQKAFDKAQQKASPVESTALNLQSVTPGDQFTLEGEEVIVRDVETDEDGNVLSVQIEDGKKFGVLNLDAQTRGAILVDEFTPRTAPDTGGGTRLPADEWQKRIDDIETELEQQGVNIFQLYNPSDAGVDILAQEGWKPMPENLAEAYRLRDEAGARELDQSRQAIFGALQQAGFSQPEINRILTYYAIDPSKSDAIQQYLAATHTVNTAKQNLNQQAESLAYALADERGIPFDELKDVNSKTLRDAANAVKVVRAYLGLPASDQFTLEGTGGGTRPPADEGDPFMRRPQSFTAGARPALAAASAAARGGAGPGTRREAGGGVSSSRFQVSGLGPAYQAATQGQSTQMVPLADVFAAAQAADPALTPEQFQAQVMAEYDAGRVLLEGAGSPQEAQSAGLRIDGTPVGTAVRMMAVPQEEVLGMAGPATAGPLPSMHSGGYPAGPGPQMQTSPPTPWSGKVQTLHGIRRRLLEAAGLPQAGLRRFTQQALGIYKVKPETVRLQAINDIPVLAHEIGHHVHYRFLSGAQPGQTTTAPDWGGVHDAELMPLGRPTSTPQYTPDQVRKEGVAEFTRLWLTNPAQARAAAPGFSKFWETELETKAPQVAEGMRQSRQMIADYIAMPAMQKAKAQIVFDPAAEITGGKIGETLRTFYTQMVDTLFPAIRAVRQAAQMDPAQADRAAEVETWMENHRGGWASKASSDVFGQQTDLFGKVVGDGLQTILKDLRPGEATDFSTYLALKRAQELEGRGLRSGFEQARLPAAEMKALEARFEPMRKKLQRWQKNERDLLVQAGLLDDKSAKAMDAANADYVPFYRLYEKLNNVSFGPENSKNAGGFVDLNSGIRAIKGSDRAIIDPLQSAMKNAFMFRKIAEQNLIGVKFFDLMREVQGAGKWGEAIAPKIKPTITSHEAIVQKLIDEGIIKDASMLPQNADLTLRMYEAITKPDTKNGEVIVFKDGKRQHWEVKDPLLMQALKHADADAVKLGGFPGWAIKLFTLPTRTLRWGATGGPWFAIPNFIRDAVQGGVLSRSGGLGGKGFVPFWDSAKGALEILRKGGAYEQWKQAGGQFAGQVTGTTAFTRMLEDALPKDRVAQRAIQGLADPKAWRTGFRNALDLVGAFGKFTEEATRVGEFMRAKQAGATDLAAANFSKIVSLNFARAGETSRVLNQFVPFFNATVQGLDQLIRAHTDPKQRGATIMKGLLYVTGPSLAVWALGKDDEEIQNLPDYRKNLFWNINLKPMAAAMGMPEEGFILSIPKPFLLGAIYGTSVERALDYATERDPNGARKAAKNILANTINPFDVMMSIGGIRPVIEATTNHSIWTGRDIVPQGYQYLPKEQQYSVLTSQTARMLGQFTGQSPMMIDHLIRGYFATAGTFGTDAIDYGMAKLALTDVPPPPRKGVMEMPLLNRFAGSPYASNAFVGRFYEAAKDMEGKLAVMNKQAEQMTSAEQKRWFDKHREELGHYLRTVDFQTGRTGAGDIRKAQAELSEINAAMKEIQASRTLKPEVKRERMIELARQRNELAEGAYKTLFPAEVRKRHY